MNEQERKFIEGWRIAGPELERLRNEKLARLDSTEGTRLATFLGITAAPTTRPPTGLIRFQALMKVWREQQKHAS